jgi:hypothetical protein
MGVYHPLCFPIFIENAAAKRTGLRHLGKLLHRGEVPLAAMDLRRVWDLAVARRRRRMF